MAQGKTQAPSRSFHALFLAYRMRGFRTTHGDQAIDGARQSDSPLQLADLPTVKHRQHPAGFRAHAAKFAIRRPETGLQGAHKGALVRSFAVAEMRHRRRWKSPMALVLCQRSIGGLEYRL
jgi:hypothetical protein